MKANQITVGKYKPGEKVFAKKDPNVALIVRRYIDRIYYCKFQDDPDKRELALFEREIVAP